MTFERVLLIETFGKVGQVAVATDDHLLDSRSLPEARRHARDLAARCKELLDEQSWKARELTAVIVNLGPGSYTGLRVGLASAKALAYAIGCPLLGVPAFEAVAVRVPLEAETLHLLADALQGQVYCQRFSQHDGHWLAAEALQIRPLADWSAEVQPGSLIAGPAVELLRERLPANGMVAPGEIHQPGCGSLLQVALRDPVRLQVDAWTVEPIYLRGSSAEEKRRLDLASHGGTRE